MNSGALRYWLAVIALLAMSYGTSVAWRKYRAAEAYSVSQGRTGAKPAPVPLKDFALVDQDGKKFESRQLRGQVWLASFFFTKCPDVCPRLNQTLAQFQRDPAFGDTRLVSITCDPQHDTPAVLKQYAERFQAGPQQWFFLTGEADYLRQLGKDSFMVSLEKATHSDRVFLIDREGKIRDNFRVTEIGELDRLKKHLVALQREGAK